MCKTYDEMIIKWAGRNSRQRRGSTKVSLVTCRAAGRVLTEGWETLLDTGSHASSSDRDVSINQEKLFELKNQINYCKIIIHIVV